MVFIFLRISTLSFISNVYSCIAWGIVIIVALNFLYFSHLDHLGVDICSFPIPFRIMHIFRFFVYYIIMEFIPKIVNVICIDFGSFYNFLGDWLIEFK